MTMLRTCSFALCAALAVNVIRAEEKQGGDEWTIPSTKEKFHVFILMGQSNMSGYGQILPEDKKAVPHVVKLPTVGEMKWVPAAHPLHNRLGSDRFGLGLPFAAEYLKRNPGVVVGLIPVAWGGDAIDQLKKCRKKCHSPGLSSQRAACRKTGTWFTSTGNPTSSLELAMPRPIPKFQSERRRSEA